MKGKIPWEEAAQIAQDFLTVIAPFTEQASVAGSVRRGKPLVGDVEIVVQPIMEPVMGLFGAMGERSALDDFPWTAWGEVVKDGPRFKQVVLSSGVTLDVFIVMPPAQWGLIYLLRTGPAAFSRWVVTPRRKGGALPSNLRVKDGAIWRGHELIPTPTEQAVFDVLGLDWMAPAVRAPLWGVGVRKEVVR